MNKTRKYTPSHTASHEHFKERFQYWQGASGHRYICSIYAPHSCPPLPGAVYIAVKREEDGARSARAVGRFASFFDTGVEMPNPLPARPVPMKFTCICWQKMTAMPNAPCVI